MADKNNKDLFSTENDKLEEAYLDSLRKLGLIDDKPVFSSKPAEPEPVKEVKAPEPEPEKLTHDPVDVHEYKDPEQEKPEVYDKIVDKINRTRAERTRSIWSDEPVIPVKKSVWLDDGEKKPAPKKPEPEVTEPKRVNKRTVELNLSESTRQKMRASEEQVPSRTRQRPEGEQVPSRTRQRPDGEQVPSRTRQRPEGEHVPSRTRQRPEGEQVPSRTRQRPEGEQVPSRTRQRPEGEQSSRTRAARTAEAPVPQRRRSKKPKFRPYETEFSFLNAALCMVLVFGVGLALIVMKRASGVIESENREYVKFPDFSVKSYFSGEYTEEITKYYTDTIPSRESLKSFSSNFSKLFGIHLDEVQLIGDVVDVEKEKVDSNQLATTTSVSIYVPPTDTLTTPTTKNPDDSTPDTTSSTTTTTTTASTTTRKKTVIPDEGEWAGNVIIINKGTPEVRSMPAFYGQFEVGKRYAGVLNKYKEQLGERVNVYNMYCPLASAYYAPKNISLSDQHECIKNCGLYLNGVVNVDAFDAIGEHIDEYIYSRTDHHWQPLGAYYAAQQFAKSAGVPFADISTYEKCKIDDFCGTMYTFSNYFAELKQYPDTFWYYKPDNEYTVNYYNQSFSQVLENYGHSLFFEWASGSSCYSCILGGDMNIAEVKTDVHNGRTLVIFKDSYGNALVPFLTHSFEKIYVCDVRYINISAIQFCKNVGATDVLFGMSISGAHNSTQINEIENNM